MTADRFHIDDDTDDAPAPHSNPVEPPHGQVWDSKARKLAPLSSTGFVWNATSQELIPMLSEDDPNFKENVGQIADAFRRWESR